MEGPQKALGDRLGMIENNRFLLFRGHKDSNFALEAEN
jgi:hypothetical protein